MRRRDEIMQKMYAIGQKKGISEAAREAEMTKIMNELCELPAPGEQAARQECPRLV